MSERKGAKNSYIHESPFGKQMAQQCLKRRDIIVFSQMYHKKDAEAAFDVLGLRVDGREIASRQYDGYIKIRSRSQAAREFFGENIGEPISTKKIQTLTRKEKINRRKKARKSRK